MTPPEADRAFRDLATIARRALAFGLDRMNAACNRPARSQEDTSLSEGRPAAPARRGSAFAAVLRVSSGNFLEMYDFFVFAFFAQDIGRTFFPSGDPFAELMSSLMTFAAGFVMRPLGALVLGAYIDRVGRRAGLILTLSLMSLGVVSIALTPGYATIGVAAPVLVVLGRLVQGFSAGVELGGVSVYLSEIATPGNKGFYVSWQSGSQQVAVMFAAGVAIALRSVFAPEQVAAWAWRIPLLIGCLIVPVVFVIRRSLQETEAFSARTRHPSPREVLASIAANWPLVGYGMMMVVMTTASFYLITTYTPTYGREVLKLTPLSGLLVTLCVGASNLLWLPLSGALSDRIGRRPLLIAFTSLAIVTVYPAMTWLVSEPSFERLLVVELWLSLLYGGFNGAMVVHLTEMMPADVRTTGFSLAYSLATIVGGLTPGACTWLIRATGDSAMPGAWMTGAAVVGLSAALLSGARERRLSHASPVRA
jgi:MFS family permease